MRLPPFHYLILGAIPPLIFAISIFQVKHPVITEPSFPKAVKAHNHYLVAALSDKPADINTSDVMLEELGRLRLALRGQQTGEKTDFKMVLHVSMGIGDSDLPNRIEWLPALLCCFATVTVLGVSVAVWSTTTMSDYYSKEARIHKEINDIGTRKDIILRRRKETNVHKLVEDTEERQELETNADLTGMSTRVEKPHIPASTIFLALVVVILIQSLILAIANGGGLDNKMFGIFRRAASLAPMECTSVLDHIMLVLNFPTQVIFYLCIARMASAFNVLFYYMFGSEKEEQPLMLTEN